MHQLGLDSSKHMITWTQANVDRAQTNVDKAQANVDNLTPNNLRGCPGYLRSMTYLASARTGTAP